MGLFEKKKQQKLRQKKISEMTKMADLGVDPEVSYNYFLSLNDRDRIYFINSIDRTILSKWKVLHLYEIGFDYNIDCRIFPIINGVHSSDPSLEHFAIPYFSKNFESTPLYVKTCIDLNLTDEEIGILNEKSRIRYEEAVANRSLEEIRRVEAFQRYVTEENPMYNRD